MKLLGTQTSPYVRKVRLVLLEKNIPHTNLAAWLTRMSARPSVRTELAGYSLQTLSTTRQCTFLTLPVQSYTYNR